MITSETTRSGRQRLQAGRVEHGHPRGPPVELRARIGVVVAVGGVEPSELDRLQADAAGGIEPFDAREQRGVVTGRLELQTQRDRRKRVPGIGAGNHRDAHRPTLPQRD